MASTPLRNLRVSDELWNRAQERAAADGTSLTAVLVSALENYTSPSKAPRIASDRLKDLRSMSDAAAWQLDAVGALSLRVTDGGEWDWYRALTDAERRRLSGRFFGKSPRWMSDGGMQPDQLAEVIAPKYGLDPGDVDACCEQWLRLTRVADLARALASGGRPKPDAYGGMTADDLFEHREQPEPWQAAVCRSGVSPAEMSFAEWHSEYVRLTGEAGQLDEWSSSTVPERLSELWPLDVPMNLPVRAVFRRVVALYEGPEQVLRA